MSKPRAQKCDSELTERFQAWWESRVKDHAPGVKALGVVLQSEVLVRRGPTGLTEAEGALRSFADYYPFHGLSGTLGWLVTSAPTTPGRTS